MNSFTPVTDEKILLIYFHSKYTAFVTFLGFTILQTFAAIYARSQAMLGDSAAMSVDAMTYAFNLAAERRKDSSDQITRLKLEIIPPCISIVTLIAVTIMIMKDAIITLLGRVPENKADEPNVDLMFLFSALNLVLDFVNMGCFARAKHAMGFNTLQIEMEEMSALEVDEGVGDDEMLSLSENTLSAEIEMKEKNNVDSDDMSDDQSANLNMCSAYTHVFADTLRSIAVLIAAGIAAVVEGVDGEMTDAVAAIIVSLIIILSTIPLLNGMIYTISELRTAYAKEAKENARSSELNDHACEYA